MDIGDIVVAKSGSGNPYRSGQNIMGRERSWALGRFLRGLSTDGYEFWYCHPSCGARQISADEAEVDPELIDFYWDDAGGPKR